MAWSTTKSCQLCGGRVGNNNVYGFCFSNEECRLAAHAASERAQRRAGKQRRESHIYAVHFSDEDLLKVGKSTYYSPWVTCGARRQARQRGFDITSRGVHIWDRPGDLREEQFMHAALSFKYPHPLTVGRNRASEWYVTDEPAEKIILKLEEVWNLMPIPEWVEG